MRKDKEKAMELRRRGLSYTRIGQELGIAKSTLAGWFKHELWSHEIKNRLSSEVSWSNSKSLASLVHANKERWRIKHEEYRNAAVREFEKYKEDPLFLAGVMLYWGEGEKQQHSSQVRLGNSEPEMLKIFYLFLTRVLNIQPDKIFAWLLLYPDLVDSVQQNFWSRSTGIPRENFRKSIYIKGKHPKKRLSYGVGTVVVSSRALKERMLKWLELYQNHLQAHAISLEK
jgi:hypothetical protein